jgi:hypothetical protein
MERSLYFAFARPSYLLVFIILILSGFTGTGYSLTADEVRALRKAGVSDETIQIMLQQEREASLRGPHDQMGVREIKDRDGNTYVVYSTGRPSGGSASDEEKERVEKAWQMLQNIIIDRRR